MASQARGCDVVSRRVEGSWTMMSPLEVVDHRACRDGGPRMPLHSQQHWDSRDS